MDDIFLIETLDDFEKASKGLLSALYYSGKDTTTLMDAATHEKAKNEMRTIISECNFDRQQIIECINKKDWNNERIKFFQNTIEDKWSDLLGAALNHYNSGYGETVINFDWFVKLVLGTSELKTLKYPLLQLIISSVNKAGQQNTLLYEVNKDMLLKTINLLENI